MHKDVVLNIRAIYPSLTAKEQAIADKILESAPRMARMTITDVAKTIGVAESTIFKFTKKLGYAGFRDFRNDLMVHQDFDVEASVHEHISADSTPLAVAQTVFDSSIKSLEDTRALLATESFEEACTLINEAATLVFFGMGGSQSVAADAYHKFMRSPKVVRHATDYHLQLMEAARMSAGDVAICISHNGTGAQISKIAHIAKEHGARIIAITSNPVSTLAQIADVILSTMAEETSYRSESLASRIAQLALIDSLFCVSMLSDEEATGKTLTSVREAIAQTRKS